MKQNQTKCPCGNKLNYLTTPYITNEKRVCPKCNRIHSVDESPIDWARVNKANNKFKEIKP